MAFEVSPVQSDDYAEFERVFRAGFGEIPETTTQAELDFFDWCDLLAARQDGRIVGTAGSYPAELTLPGAVRLPTAAVTSVSVSPTHRRRGVLSAMMAEQLAAVRGAGVPLAVLTASEATIYSRFGYGPATMAADFVIPGRARALRQPIPVGDTRLLSQDEARKTLPELYEPVARTQVGELSRPDGWWALANSRDMAKNFAVVHRSEGIDDGYAIYGVEVKWEPGVSQNRLRVDELVAHSPAARSALLRFLLEVDLIESVYFRVRPVEDELRWLLADPRVLRARSVRDWLWVRPVDAAAVLSARRYRVADRLTIRIEDELCPWNAATWSVEGSPDGAECRPAPTGSDPDLTMGPAGLGSLVLGGVNPSVLVDAGVIGAAAGFDRDRADLFFGANQAPFCSTAF
ncbi:MAG: GNAT family N-acetyltransferase [Acidimicrobiales bacterium]